MPGLVVFIVVIAVDLCVLLFDLALALSGLRTITGRVRQYPLLGVPLLVWQFVGVLGLAWHFYA